MNLNLNAEEVVELFARLEKTSPLTGEENKQIVDVKNRLHSYIVDAISRSAFNNWEHNVNKKIETIKSDEVLSGKE